MNKKEDIVRRIRQLIGEGRILDDWYDEIGCAKITDITEVGGVVIVADRYGQLRRVTEKQLETVIRLALPRSKKHTKMFGKD